MKAISFFSMKKDLPISILVDREAQQSTNADLALSKSPDTKVLRPLAFLKSWKYTKIFEGTYRYAVYETWSLHESFHSQSTAQEYGINLAHTALFDSKLQIGDYSRTFLKD